MIYLEDLEEDKLHDLSLGAYEFFHSENSHPERFLLHFSLISDTPDQSQQEELKIYSYGACVYVNVPAFQTGLARVYDLTGKEVCSFDVQNGLTKKALPGTGYYIVSVVSGNLARNEKVYITN